jgi:hypothetical protein
MDVLDVALLVSDALERTGVGYFLGGSLASSFQGEPRATNDIDLVVELTEEKVSPLAEALGPDFDVDLPALRRAARERTSWNLVHVPTVAAGGVPLRVGPGLVAPVAGCKRRFSETASRARHLHGLGPRGADRRARSHLPPLAAGGGDGILSA